MSTENTEANVADKLAQALRDLIEACEILGDYAVDTEEFDAARAALAAHEAEKATALPNGRQFRKKPVVIEAFQMTVERRMDNSEWPDWLNEAWNKDEGQAGALFRQSTDDPMPDMLCIQTLEGVHLVGWGDWIIRGVKGELYPCKPDIFAATYEAADAAPAAPVAAPLTDDEIRETLKTTNHMVRNCMHGPFWPELEQACRAIERTLAARWGIKLEGGQG